MVKYFRPLESPMNKNITFLFIVKNISFIQFSSCHTSDENFLASNFSQTTVVTHAYKNTQVDRYTIHTKYIPMYISGPEVAIALLVSEPLACTMLLNFSVSMFDISRAFVTSSSYCSLTYFSLNFSGSYQTHCNNYNTM